MRVDLRDLRIEATGSSTPDPKHRHAAAAEQTHTRRAARDLDDACIAVGTILGKPLGMELSRRVEDLTEHAGEHVYHLEREIERLDEVIGTLNREIESIKTGRDRAIRAYLHLDTELRNRARRARRPFPPVIHEAAALLSADPEPQAPF